MSFFTRLRRRHHEPTFLDTLTEVDSFKALVKKQPCPGCGQTGNTLELVSFVRNPKGWDATLQCTNCNFTGAVNSYGFDMKKLNSKGKAVDKK